MQESVPSQSDVQSTFAATLFDEWIRSGLRDVVLCPGSRSTPLAVACAAREELQVHVRLDERSAAFFAIGLALASSKPVAVVVTSGPAAAELHAAVCEADAANVPLLVLTADRPPELHGVGAPQTIDQRALFGTAVRLFEDPGVARWNASSSWRALANRFWVSALGEGKPSGPVHLNAAFVEPLLGVTLPLPQPRVAGPWRSRVDAKEQSSLPSVNGARVLAIVGAGVAPSTILTCRELNWVVLGDATAQGSLAYYDPILRDDAVATSYRPDLIVRIGGLPASKCLQERMREWQTTVVAFGGGGPVADPDGLVQATYEGLPSADLDALRADVDYANEWLRSSLNVDELICAITSEDGVLSEPVVARTVVEVSGDLGIPLVVGSSMPVRDVEWWSNSRRSPTYANRGVNGIDGVVSTVFGVCAGSKGIGFVGDLTLLHDVSALVDGLGEQGGSCVLVVSDNQGGGIFSFLPQATALDEESFEQLFATPRAHDLEAIVSAFGHDATTVSTKRALRVAMEKGLSDNGISVVIAKVPDRSENVRIHEHLTELVRRSIGD